MTVADALFAILETQRLLDGKAQLTMLPNQGNLLAQLVAVQGPRVSN
jgi:hypothetical protein